MILGDFIKNDGLVEDNKLFILELKKVVQDKVYNDLVDQGYTLTDFTFEYVIKQQWENTNGMVGITKVDDDAKPFYTVGFKATNKPSNEHLCQHGNYHCNKCEIVLLKKVIEDYEKSMDEILSLSELEEDYENSQKTMLAINKISGGLKK